MSLRQESELCAWSSYFEKQISVRRKRTIGQNKSEGMQRAAADSKEADRRAELERRRAKEQEEKTRRITFEEYIRAYHTLLSEPHRI
jgi:hypothetical protein